MHSWIIKILAKTGRQARGYLIKALKDNDPWVRLEAAKALGKIGDQRGIDLLIEALGDYYLRNTAVRALVEIGEPAIEPLSRALRDRDIGGQEGAAEALMKIGKPAVEVLIEALRDKACRRDIVALALGEIGDIRAIPYLREALDDVNPTVCKAAVLALEEIGKPPVDQLINALGDEDLQVRQKIAWELGMISESAMEALIRALKDEDWKVREGAARALGWIGGKRAVKLLIGMLGDEDWSARKGAIWALGKIGDVSAIEPLDILTREDKHPWVREEAKRAIDKIKHL